MFRGAIRVGEALPRMGRRGHTVYKTVIKHLQQMLPLDDILPKSLSCLNPESQEDCIVVARNMPNLSDGRARYGG